MTTPEEKQQIIEEERLRLLSWGYYIAAAISAAYACFPILHLIAGIALVLVGDNLHSNGEPMPPFMGWFFVAGAGVMIALGAAFAALQFIAGKMISQRRQYVFCVIAAVVTCLQCPHGTALGGVTFVLLSKPTIKSRFT